MAFEASIIGSSLFQLLLFFMGILRGSIIPCCPYICVSPFHLCSFVASAWNAYLPPVFPNHASFLISSGHLLCARLCSKWFTWINSFNFHYSPLRLMLFLSLLCRWRSKIEHKQRWLLFWPLKGICNPVWPLRLLRNMLLPPFLSSEFFCWDYLLQLISFLVTYYFPT